jgi:serine/threonine protein phosphatase PrpC
MRVEVGVATDLGKVREGNEDSYLVDPPLLLYAVADGMGGHRGGEVASHLALETVESLARAGTGTLAEQVHEANRTVYERSQRDRRVTGMGTTLTAARIVDDAVFLAHVGDSRAYLLRAGAFRQLTEDHTLVNRMVRAGEITADEADVHPHRNVLTRALGTEPDVEVDEDEVALMEGDRLLLCSDGLFGMVTEDQIQAILENEPDPQHAVDRLVRAANRAGGVDNITALVLDAHDAEPGADDAIAGDISGVVGGTDPGRRQRLTRRVGRVGLVVLVLVAAAFLGRHYVDSQWYVGIANSHVAVFQGIPASPLGYSLSHVVEVTELPASDVEQLAAHDNLADGINANSRAEAEAIVQQMRTDLQTAQQQEAPPP